MHVVAFDVEYQPHYNSKCCCPTVFIICILGYKITISVASWIDAAHRIPAHYSQFAFSTRYTERDILGVNDYSHVTIYGNAYMQGASVYLIVPHTHTVFCVLWIIRYLKMYVKTAAGNVSQRYGWHPRVVLPGTLWARHCTNSVNALCVQRDRTCSAFD